MDCFSCSCHEGRTYHYRVVREELIILARNTDQLPERIVVGYPDGVAMRTFRIIVLQAATNVLDVQKTAPANYRNGETPNGRFVSNP